MALEGSYDYKGASFSSAYYKLNSVYVDNNGGIVKLRMEVYPDQNARDNGKDPLEVFDPLSEDDADDASTVFDNHFAPSADWSASEDPLEKGYKYLKNNTSRFSGMTDV